MSASEGHRLRPCPLRTAFLLLSAGGCTSAPRPRVGRPTGQVAQAQAASSGLNLLLLFSAWPAEVSCLVKLPFLWHCASYAFQLLKNIWFEWNQWLWDSSSFKGKATRNVDRQKQWHIRLTSISRTASVLRSLPPLSWQWETGNNKVLNTWIFFFTVG